MSPFGFIVDGFEDEETKFVDEYGDVWHLDEYGDVAPEVSYMLGY